MLLPTSPTPMFYLASCFTFSHLCLVTLCHSYPGPRVVQLCHVQSLPPLVSPKLLGHSLDYVHRIILGCTVYIYMYHLLAPYLYHTNTGLPGIIRGLPKAPHHHYVRVSQNTRVTPAVSGLSRDGYPTPGTSLSEYPRTLPEGSQGLGSHPGTIPGLLGVTPLFWDTLTGVPRGWVIIPGQSQDCRCTLAFWDTLTEGLGSYPGTTPGLPV